jgi:hypothetical protein
LFRQINLSLGFVKNWGYKCPVPVKFELFLQFLVQLTLYTLRKEPFITFQRRTVDFKKCIKYAGVSSVFIGSRSEISAATRMRLYDQAIK